MGCLVSGQKSKEIADDDAPFPADDAEPFTSASPPAQNSMSRDNEAGKKNDKRREWGQDMGDELQVAIDRVFQREGGDLLGLKFSFTIADPNMEDCPLIGCSTGFSTLCGYEMNEIVGRNCRFLIEPVPKDLLDMRTRKRARDFCLAAMRGEDYHLGDLEKDDWMPKHKAGELFCVQTNARKEGTLFKNMFYMRTCELNEQTYVVALQTEMTDVVQGVIDKAARCLVSNMDELERLLAKQFWYSGPMRRQEMREDDGYEKMRELIKL